MIIRIKNIIKKLHLNGYIVPKNNKFFTKYSKKNKLQILANFTRSAGFALILKNNNHLFFDEKYTIQAKKQSNKKFFIHEIPYVCPKNILKKKNTYRSIGFDPKFFTKYLCWEIF
jgi:Creatinase/Prolidase N-terminal domain.